MQAVQVATSQSVEFRALANTLGVLSLGGAIVLIQLSWKEVHWAIANGLRHGLVVCALVGGR